VETGCWRLAVKLLTERGRLSEAAARRFVGKLKAQLSNEELWSIAVAAWTSETLDPRAYLIAAAQGQIERRQGSGVADPSERQQRAWMVDYRDRGALGWRVNERGPRPGEPGCRVCGEIQREFGFGAAA
jgi:hypothetical protein